MLLENEVANVTLDLIGEAVLRTDAHGHITYLNRMAEDMTGWRREEARGHPVADVLRITESVSGTAFVTVAGMVAQKEKTTAENGQL
jgi:PAS domain-containing protein